MMRKEGWDALLKRAKQLGVGIGTWGYQWSRDPSWSIMDAPLAAISQLGRDTLAELRELDSSCTPGPLMDVGRCGWCRSFGADGFFTNRPELALLFYGRADHIDLKPMWGRESDTELAWMALRFIWTDAALIAA
jgi:hypothetical protein